MFNFKGILGSLLNMFFGQAFTMFAFPPTVASVATSITNYPSVSK